MFKLFSIYRIVRRLGFRNIFSALRSLPRYGKLYPRLFADPRTPILAKALVVGVVFYLLSPLDVVPDFIPLLGQMDDLALLMFAGSKFISMCPPYVRREHELACGLGRHDAVRGSFDSARTTS